ncbi:DUF6285 domain-containing protein [Nocardia sp. NPDC051570]|uniref:DUF6285 domain-containing protein n=1 Tax=Nocardia sp. NPDC051570 TaxID=3364324 RepID=UPI00378A34F9
MQYRPTATEILDSLAELLDDVLLPALPDALQHRARVAANLTRIVRRELDLGPVTARRERELMATIPGSLDSWRDPEPNSGVVEPDSGSVEDEDAALWRVLVEVVRGDLAIAKPGYDGWEGL